MLSQQELIEHITPTNIQQSPSGIECHFIKIDEKWGMKLYYIKGTRDSAHKKQSIAAKHNLGPEVGDTFEFGEYFGYFTRIAEILSNKMDFKRYEETIKQYGKEINNLRESLKGLDINSYIDLHFANVGFYNNKLVCIDFGDAMFPSSAARLYGEKFCYPDEDI